MQYEIKKVNWVECIFAPMKDANSVTVQIFVKAWSLYETEKTNGISHFLEHMFFKWGKKYTTPQEVASVVDAFGGKFNAYTSDEDAGYYIKCAPEFVDQSIDVLGDMMVNAQFNKEEMEREKWVVLQEIMMKQDNPSSLVFDKRKRYYCGNNSYGWSTLGPEENIKSFTQDMLFEHRDSLYTKDNLLIVVAGKIQDQSHIEQKISDAFGKLPKEKKLEKPTYHDFLPTKRKDFYDKKTEQNHMIMAAKGFDWNDEKKFAANILATILWGNMSSRLFQNVREKEWLCYYIWGAHYSGTDDGTFLFRAGMDKWRFDFALQRVHEEIDRIAQWDSTQDEFEKSIGYRVGNIQMWIESSDEMAEFLGDQYLLYGKIETLDDVLQKYKALTLKDVQSVAQKLAKDNLYLYWIQ